jgi:DNA-binding NarL/FixJ family response regulator
MDDYVPTVPLVPVCVRIEAPGALGDALRLALSQTPGIECVPTAADACISLGWEPGLIRERDGNSTTAVDPPRTLVLVQGLDQEAALAAVEGVVAFCHHAARVDELVAGIRAAASQRVFYSEPLGAELELGMEVARRAGSDQPQDLVQLLTAAERRVALLAASGMEWAEIADSLSVGLETVRTHRRHLYDKLEVHDRKMLRERFWAALWLPAGRRGGQRSRRKGRGGLQGGVSPAVRREVPCCSRGGPCTKDHPIVGDADGRSTG